MYEECAKSRALNTPAPPLELLKVERPQILEYSQIQ